MAYDKKPAQSAMQFKQAELAMLPQAASAQAKAESTPVQASSKRERPGADTYGEESALPVSKKRRGKTRECQVEDRAAARNDISVRFGVVFYSRNLKVMTPLVSLVWHATIAVLRYGI